LALPMTRTGGRGKGEERKKGAKQNLYEENRGRETQSLFCREEGKKREGG